MDYARIYAELISDRRAKSVPPDTYTERHHVIPRALGGTDDLDNLIDLTPEDHLFAHLLLAKIHGGLMWSAVSLMCITTGAFDKRSPGTKGRIVPDMIRKYAAAKKLASSKLSGEGNWKTDLTVYQWRNVDGREEHLRRFEFGRKHSIGLGALCVLMRGNTKSHKGWYLPHLVPSGIIGTAANTGINSTSSDKVKYNFQHLDGKREFTTRRELIATYNLPSKSLDSLFMGITKSAHGWFLSDKTCVDEVGRITGADHHSYDAEIRTYIHSDGRVERCTSFQMHAKYGGESSAWSRVKKRGSAYGWVVEGVAVKRTLKGVSLTFSHQDGRVFTGRQSEFAALSGMSTKAASRVSRGKPLHGWSLLPANDNNAAHLLSEAA